MSRRGRAKIALHVHELYKNPAARLISTYGPYGGCGPVRLAPKAREINAYAAIDHLCQVGALYISRGGLSLDAGGKLQLLRQHRLRSPLRAHLIGAHAFYGGRIARRRRE